MEYNAVINVDITQLAILIRISSDNITKTHIDIIQLLRVSYRNLSIIKSDGPWARTRAADSRVSHTTNYIHGRHRSAFC